MKTLILLSAVPGSGKSTWAKQYQNEHQNVFIVSSDEIRLELTGKAQSFSKEDMVWKLYLQRINEYAEKYDDVTVIADSTNLQNQYRKFYHDNTPLFDKHILVLFNIPYDICLLQNNLRPEGKIVPLYAMEMLHKEFEEPTKEIIDLYDEYRVIGQSFISESLKK
ncbi:MAG: AAA family ATPase [Bacilli bacterium]|nr:AAA family ATPase [Bacilli bacterium]